MSNLVSLSRLTAKGVHWNTQEGCLTRQGTPIAYIQQIKGHWSLSHYSQLNSAHAAAATSIKQTTIVQTLAVVRITTQEPQAIPSGVSEDTPSSLATQTLDSRDTELTQLWHRRLGHPGIDALRHLQGSTEGIEGFTVDAASVSHCDTCRLAKATQQISRSSDKEHQEPEPFYRVSCDFIEWDEGYNGDTFVLHFKCFYTRMNFVYTTVQHRGLTQILRRFLSYIQNHFRKKVKFLRFDGETAIENDFNDVLTSHGIILEQSASYVPVQNGYAERVGRSIIEKARALRLEASLLSSLWPELAKTAGYLLNRTPVQQLGFRTPFEALYGKKPTRTHLKAIGCKAFVLKYNIPKRKKLDARVDLGYLVGYNSRNIWRIWRPKDNVVLRSRDVKFDETSLYDPSDSLTPLDELASIPEILDLVDSSY